MFKGPWTKGKTFSSIAVVVVVVALIIFLAIYFSNSRCIASFTLPAQGKVSVQRGVLYQSDKARYFHLSNTFITNSILRSGATPVTLVWIGSNNQATIYVGNYTPQQIQEDMAQPFPVLPQLKISALGFVSESGSLLFYNRTWKRLETSTFVHFRNVILLCH